MKSAEVSPEIIHIENTRGNWGLGLRRALGYHQLGLAIAGEVVVEAPMMLSYESASPAEFALALKNSYGEWGLGELSRLIFNLKAAGIVKDPEFLKSFFSHPDRALETLEKLYALPYHFQNWCDDKKMSVQDLAPLRALKEPALVSEFCEKLASSNFSKSQGAQILEWACDCALMGKIIPSPASDADFEKKWFEDIRKIRFPATAQTDTENKKQLTELHWPKNSEAKWIRKGDRGYLELKLWSGTPEELEKQSEALLKAAKEWRAELNKTETH